MNSPTDGFIRGVHTCTSYIQILVRPFRMMAVRLCTLLLLQFLVVWKNAIFKIENWFCIHGKIGILFSILDLTKQRENCIGVGPNMKCNKMKKN